MMVDELVMISSGICEHSSFTRLFFFFQAEDGIRDLTVTGVQTCALPIYNRAVDSLFAVRTDRIPGGVHVSPRVGFTWQVGGWPKGSTFLRGGIGDFRSLPPTSLYAAALGAPGLSSAETDLVSVGSAGPIPHWSRYAPHPSP